MLRFTRLSIVPAALLGLCVALAGCENNDPPKPVAPTATKTLYERLGGEKAVTAVVDDFVNRAAGDAKVNFTRKGIPGAEWEASADNVAKLKKHLAQFIAGATGGPKDYAGKDMKSLHKGMAITDAEFGAIAADLSASLDKLGVAAKDKADLLAVVGSTKDAIVEKH